MKSNDIPQKGGKEFLDILTEAHQAASGEEGQARPAGGQPELRQDPPEAKPERVGIHCCRRRARQGGGLEAEGTGDPPGWPGVTRRSCSIFHATHFPECSRKPHGIQAEGEASCKCLDRV